MKTISRTILGGVALSATSFASITSVDLELSLVIDVSGSVSTAEYNLMMEGYAQAFENAVIQSAITGGTIGAIAVDVVQFASTAAEVVPWTLIDSAAAADAFAGVLRTTPESGAIGGSTGIGEGIAVSAGTFAGNAFEAPRQVIDVSGDGDTNTGQSTSGARDAALAGEIDTINGIVISDGDGSLAQHYMDEVIGGPGSFVTSATDFADFANEILAKLQAEITGRPLSDSGTLAVARAAQLALARTSYQDINSRLFRARAGVRGPEPVEIPGGFAPIADKGAKGGMPKGVMTPPTYQRKPWEVFGSVGFHYSEGDEVSQSIAGTVAVPVIPEYEMSLWSGTVGVEYDFNENFSLGGAIIGGEGEIDIKGALEDIDVDSWGVAIYGTYYRPDAFNAMGGTGDFWADLLYGYTDADYDADTAGKADGMSHLLDFNTGVNFRNGQLTHGPYGGIAWEDNELDPSGGGPSVDFDSLVTTLGYQVSYLMMTGAGNVIPQGRVAWEHEFEDDDVTVGGLSLGEPDSDQLVLGAGVLWQFHQNFYAVLDYEAHLGDETDSHSVLLRVGGTF